MLKGMSLRMKLLGAFAMVSALLVVVGGFSYRTSYKIVNDYTHITKINLPNTLHLGEMGKTFRSVRIQLRTLAIDGLTDQEVRDIAAETEANIKEYEAADKSYTSIPLSPGEEELYKAVNAAWLAFKAEGIKQLQLAQSKKPADRSEFKEFVIHQCPVLAHQYYDALQVLEKYQIKEAAQWSEKADTGAEQGNGLVLIMVIAGGVLGLSAGVWITRQVNSQLSGIAARLNSGADEIANASVQVSSASEQLSASATEQAASLQETSASVTELSQMVAKNAENAQAASQTSQESQAKASEGRAAVEQMIQAIQDIDQSTLDISAQVEESNREIGQIIKVIADIQDKTKVINDIVFQTKLLSFNASVEAARAGEHGKGFAVVAEEVGNLAQMSGNASKEISSLLASSLENVERTIRESQSKVSTLVESSKGKVRTGSEVAQHCGEVLTALVDTAATVNQLAQEISVASQEQASGIREIDQAVGQLDQVTQQNSAAAGQTANSANGLSSQAGDLRQVVQDLFSIVNGSKKPGSPAAPSVAKPKKTSEEAKTSKNILPFKKTASKVTKAASIKASPSSHSKTQTPVQAAPAVPVSSPELKQAAGSDIPSPDDKRFHDI